MSSHDRRVEAFGRTVLGPVFGEFALRLHLLLLALDAPGETKLLFCARGGLRLRLIYEAFLAAAGLEPPIGYADFMISRLIAARTALEKASPAAFEELGREFKGEPMGAVLRALTQHDLPDAAALAEPFTPQALAALISADTPLGRAVRAQLAAQNRLFDAHLASVAGSARRLLLCDTGLYGSTVRLLRAGRPEHAWWCALFARSNYKGFAESHFPVTVGLVVESNGYDAAEPRTCVLRYWHLIESCLEPALPSVLGFAWADGAPRANLAVPGWEAALEGRPGELFAGVMAYLRELPRQGAAERIYADGPLAWRRLHDAITWPGPQQRELLAAGPRSRDFGRQDAVQVIRPHGVRGGLREVQGSLWREGAIVAHFPASRLIWQGGLHAAHLGRRAMALVRRGV